MKRSSLIILGLDAAFMALLIISSYIKGATSDVLYYLAFAIPILIGIAYLAVKGRGDGDVIAAFSLKLDKDGARLCLPLAFPSIGLVTVFAFLTSLILTAMGLENNTSFTEPFAIAVMLHALLPAIREELLFRLIPIGVLSREHSASFTLLFSAAIFAIAHLDPFKIPYAFIAGMIFGSIFLATRSVIPSIVIHFINNLLSLINIYYNADIYVYIGIAVLSVISLIYVIMKRNIYIKALKGIFTSHGLQRD
ncbi:MAG: CPBP family intramembrane metalloprotease [Clostridia bacterium]|nr:CPBP family intramembrane metalloprotease [Clostridia bacterium]